MQQGLTPLACVTPTTAERYVRESHDGHVIHDVFPRRDAGPGTREIEVPVAVDTP